MTVITGEMHEELMQPLRDTLLALKLEQDYTNSLLEDIRDIMRDLNSCLTYQNEYKYNKTIEKHKRVLDAISNRNVRPVGNRSTRH